MKEINNDDESTTISI